MIEGTFRNDVMQRRGGGKPFCDNRVLGLWQQPIDKPNLYIGLRINIISRSVDLLSTVL